MDFSFGRQSSRDFLLKKSESLKSSFSGGSSRIISSASDVKNGLFGGITSMQSRIDQLSHKIGTGSLDIEESGETTVDQPDAAVQRPKQRPKKPPLPKRISEGSLNGSIKQFNGSREQEGPKKRIRAPSGEAINFDEPLYDTHDGGLKGSVAASNQEQTRNYIQANHRPQTTGIHNPFMNDNQQDQMTTVFAEIHTGTSEVAAPSPRPAINVSDSTQHQQRPDLMQRRQTNPFIDIEEPGQLLASHGGAGAGVLGADLLPGIPRVPSQPQTDFLNASPEGKDLFAITPSSGEALPIPGINPAPAEGEPGEDEDANYSRDPNEIYDDSDGDSEATEGCDEVLDDGLDYQDHTDGRGGGDIMQSRSVSSDLSWCSSDSNMDELSRECMAFMKDYVTKIFDNSLRISAVDKSRFGEMCQHEAGRLWFARYINVQRVNNKRVSEQTFFQLVQYFAIVLFECNDHEDYGPAKTLMNMCFTYYHEVDHPTGPSYKHFLYSYLKDQLIWQSLKFWNAAFFDAVMCERSRPHNPAESENENVYQENIVFGQLGTFTCNMRAFGLSKELCLDFLRKQSSIAQLREEKLQMLKENIERGPDNQNRKR